MQLAQLVAQRDRLSSRIENIEQQQRYLDFVSEDELDYLDQLDLVEALIEQLEPSRDMASTKEKHRLLRGLLEYAIETDFPRRLWGVKRELNKLNLAVTEAEKLSASLNAAVFENDDRLDDLAARISGQDATIEPLRQRSAELIAQQKRLINQMATAAIDAQIRQIEEFQLNARYSLARLYDQLASNGAKP